MTLLEPLLGTIQPTSSMCSAYWRYPSGRTNSFLRCTEIMNGAGRSVWTIERRLGLGNMGLRVDTHILNTVQLAASYLQNLTTLLPTVVISTPALRSSMILEMPASRYFHLNAWISACSPTACSC